MEQVYIITWALKNFSIYAIVLVLFRRKGSFYLRTLPAAPYGMGLKGVKNIIPTKNSTFSYKSYYIDHGQYLPANYDICHNLG